MKEFFAAVLCALLIVHMPMARASESGSGLIGGASSSYDKRNGDAESDPAADASAPREQLSPFTPPSVEEYTAALLERMEAEGLDYARDGASISAGELARIDISGANGAIESISITARGDGSARSGELMSRVLICAIQAYSGYGRSMISGKLLSLISLTSGEDALPGLKISLKWSADSLRMTLTPSSEAPPKQQDSEQRRPLPGNVSELITYCAALLPEGWTQTSYLSDAPSSALINIYSDSAQVDALWDCAHAVLSRFWSTASKANLECDRLSIVFYSSDMTPLLSLGISRKDALSCTALGKDGTPEQLMQEMDRLSGESDALIVRHYEDG